MLKYLNLELKSSLYGLFSTYGPILDITAKKTQKMREQAFIVYNNVASATTAKRSLNGFTFFDRPIVSLSVYTKKITLLIFSNTRKLNMQRPNQTLLPS